MQWYATLKIIQDLWQLPVHCTMPVGTVAGFCRPKLVIKISNESHLVVARWGYGNKLTRESPWD